MKKGIIGKKIGMTQIFDEKGSVIPVTVIEAGPCAVTQKKTVENDGYASVQLGYGDIKPERLTKPMKGHFDKSGTAPKKTLREFRLENADALKVGDVLKADVFTSTRSAKGKATPASSSAGTSSASRNPTAPALWPATAVPTAPTRALPECSRA